MEIITINDVIGWRDSDASWLKELLAIADGAPIRVDISSPGGLVFEGIKMYNLLKAYPGEVTTRIDGLAASMASYISQAADEGKREVMSNGVYMIHNAWSFAAGDHNELRKEANTLEGLSSTLSSAYTARSGKTATEVKAMMDAESWFFGEEVVDSGFADTLIDADGITTNKSEALALGKSSFSSAMTKVRGDQEKVRADLNQAAAMINATKTEKPRETIPVKNMTGGNKVSELTKETLKRDNPDLYNSIIEDGKASAIASEKTRISRLMSWKSTDKSLDIIMEAIQSGATQDDCMATLMQEKTVLTMGTTHEDNPPDIQGSSSTPPDETPTGEGKSKTMSDENYKKVRAMIKAGL